MDKFIFVKFIFYIILIGTIITVLITKKDREKYYIKAVITVVSLLVAVVISFLLYFCSYDIINKIDVNIFNSYATDGKIEQAIYFSKEIDDETEINDTIMEIVDRTKDIDELSKKISELDNDYLRIQNILGVIARNRVISEECINNNHKYVDYLRTKNLQVSDCINYCEKIYELDENIQRGCFYISFTVVISILLFKLKYRKGTYSWCALIYILIILNDFTKGLFGQLMFHIEIVSNNISANDFQTLTTLLMPALKEAFLTVIIFDGVYQFSEQRKSENNLDKKFEDIQNITQKTIGDEKNKIYKKIENLNNKIRKMKNK
ncbi:MAG: hypothetical protein E7B53_19595 [Clostridium sp.]|uniref:hypothetical protein n=1 Tax=Clostridium sp. TaxID=1506 RepID=UPI0029018EF7|nr:hypothetical protein [Clostridium sp.]MDU2896961.1 hypothetical protein [Clostridium sp.]MDU3009135.1 hypothetical protein [Clostridium sp.]MDU3039286.1 hypothetical protein [Clostridium sp.]MDU3053414.1 hypothetical protein [Clostridium sp.]